MVEDKPIGNLTCEGPKHEKYAYTRGFKWWSNEIVHKGALGTYGSTQRHYHYLHVQFSESSGDSVRVEEENITSAQPSTCVP